MIHLPKLVGPGVQERKTTREIGTPGLSQVLQTFSKRTDARIAGRVAAAVAVECVYEADVGTSGQRILVNAKATVLVRARDVTDSLKTYSGFGK